MGIEDRVKIRIEPGLFEFLGWYERGLPSFFNSSELTINEEEMELYNIDRNYRPIIPLEKLSRDEKYIDYYNRSYKVAQQITDKHKLTGNRRKRNKEFFLFCYVRKILFQELIFFLLVMQPHLKFAHVNYVYFRLGHILILIVQFAKFLI